jgi:hypothetical protein
MGRAGSSIFTHKLELLGSSYHMHTINADHHDAQRAMHALLAQRRLSSGWQPVMHVE